MDEKALADLVVSCRRQLHPQLLPFPPSARDAQPLERADHSIRVRLLGENHVIELAVAGAAALLECDDVLNYKPDQLPLDQQPLRLNLGKLRHRDEQSDEVLSDQLAMKNPESVWSPHFFK